jgi:hypothetical protein
MYENSKKHDVAFFQCQPLAFAREMMIVLYLRFALRAAVKEHVDSNFVGTMPNVLREATLQNVNVYQGIMEMTQECPAHSVRF